MLAPAPVITNTRLQFEMIAAKSLTGDREIRFSMCGESEPNANWCTIFVYDRMLGSMCDLRAP